MQQEAAEVAGDHEMITDYVVFQFYPSCFLLRGTFVMRLDAVGQGMRDADTRLESASL
jgi:hypothetical protein